LTFDSAALFGNRGGFSSIRLYLRSSQRLLVLRVYWSGAMKMDVLLDQQRSVLKKHAGKG
jgi:hypothetical protein